MNRVINSRGTKLILFSIALLDFMGFTIGATVFPELLVNPSHGLLPAAFSHEIRLVMVGVLLAIYPLGQFLTASVFGAASDRWGRKPILIVTLLGTVISCLLTAISISAEMGALLFISRFMLGLFAGNVSVAQASIVDISDTKSKAANISLIQLSLGLAWVVGAPIGSVLSNSAYVSWFSSSTPFWVLLACLTTILLAVIFGYKSTEKEKRNDQKLNPFNGIQMAIDSITHQNYKDMFIVWFIFIVGWSMFLQFIPTFLIINFNYTTQSVGPILAFMGGTFACTQLFIARPVLRRFSPEKVLTFIMCGPGIAAILFILVKGWWPLHIAAFLFPFTMGFTLPSLVASISNRGEANEQGKLLGMAMSTQALMTIISTLIGGKLIAINHSLSVVVGSSLMIIGWAIFVLYARNKSNIVKEKLIEATQNG